MKFVLEHVPFGHLLEVQTSKLVSRQDGNSLSAFNSHKAQVSAGCVGLKLFWDSTQTVRVNTQLHLCCNTLANFISYFYLFYSHIMCSEHSFPSLQSSKIPSLPIYSLDLQLSPQM